MPKTKKDNIILRVDEKDHDIFRFKSEIFGISKSDMLRRAGLGYWQDGKSFKTITGIYKDSSSDQKDMIVSILVKLYREQGFPHYDLNAEEKIKQMGRLIRTKNPLIDGDHLNQNVVGIALANSFHPHMLSVKYSNTKTKTAFEMFDNDEHLKDCIRRWLDLGRVVDPSGLRRILKNRDGARAVVNFKPAIAKFVYDEYAPDFGRVLDPCSGYSGRLVGCISTLKGIRYHGIDPDPRTAKGNMDCAAFFSSYHDAVGEMTYPFGFDFSLGCAEDIMPTLKDSSYDLIFTSPPYFDLEKYDDSPNQSYKRYPEYHMWLKGFLFPLIKESKRLLSAAGYFVLNVKNYGKYNIVEDSKKYASEIGLKLSRQYEMRLANYEFHLKKGEDTWHSEPIMVFQSSENK